MRDGPIVGILLAAGSATRFGGDKLLAKMAGDMPIGVVALKNLVASVDAVVAVVRLGDNALATVLAAHDARVTACPRAADGMGESLAWGVRAAPAAAAWLIALSGDAGAKTILARHNVALVATEDAGVLRDVDTPQDLER